MSYNHDIARDIADDLHRTEMAFAPALVALGDFCSRMPAYEASVGVTATISQPVYESMAKAFAAVVDGRGQVVRSHRQILRIGKANNIIPATAVGPDDCPPSNAPADAQVFPEMRAFSTSDLV